MSRPTTKHVESLATAAVRHRPPHPGLLNGLSTPIVTATTYQLPSPDAAARLALQPERPVTPSTPDSDGFFYSRWGSPTAEVACSVVADLEGVDVDGGGSWCFGSGMAAITSTLVSVCGSGDHIVAPASMYGGTVEWLTEFGAGLGLEYTLVDATAGPDAYAEAIRPGKTALLYAEAVSNPTCRVTDLPALGALGVDANIPVVVDATFATPYHLKALSVPGVLASIHAGTKYLSGHSDILSGVVSTNDPELVQRLGKALKLFGGVASAFDAYLLVRGIKSFDARMRVHNANATAVAAFLNDHPKVCAVHHPSLPDHPDHELANRVLSNGFGGMMAFDVGSLEAARAVIENLRLVSMAVSLGSVESLAEHPASMTHAMVPRDVREQGGITDGLIRFSVGIEGQEDLVQDLSQALDAC